MKVLGFAFSPLLKLVGGLFKGPKPGEPPRPVTRDDAEEAARQRQELTRRRGGAADILTGAAGLGVEAGPGAKATLGS